MRISATTSRLAVTAVLLGASCLAAPAAAQDDDALYWAERLKSRSITVIATRSPIALSDVPVTVTVIDDEQIADELATDIKDLVRFEPGVTVQRQPTRFGAALGTVGRTGNDGFTIRGMGGNRTLILVDGVRVPDGFSFGAQSVGRGDYVDLGLVKRVEILRGPASALYGSDGLSGAVAFTLSDPEDFLRDGASFGGLARAGYSSDDNEFSETAILAAGGGEFSVMAAYTRRDFHELENMGTVDASNSTRTVPNPQDGHSDALLGRIVWKAGGGHTVRLTGEHTDTYLFTDVLSGRSGSVLDLKGTDTGSRTRFAGDWTWDNGAGDGFIDYFHLGLYWQDAKDRQFTAEDRNPAVDRTRDNTFNNRVHGAAAEARKTFETGSVEHRLVFGGDLSFTRQEGQRSGTVPPAGETFPTRAFPVTDFRLGGLFIGDDISFGDGTFTLFPALRFDSYKLDATNDPLLPTFVEADQSGSHLSPKLGAVVKQGDFRLFGNYAQGFKAPSPSQVNNFFENPAQGYKSLPNPDLEPETSRSFEGGARYAGEIFSAGVTAFHSKYRNFIEQIQVSGSFTPSDPALYQWQNLTGAVISGIEARGDLNLDNGITGRIALAYADGDQIAANGAKTPLQSINPFSIVAGLGWRDPGGKFGGELIATHNSRKPAAEAAAGAYRPDSFTILDATAFVRIADLVTIRVGVFNIFDEKYTYWADVRGLADSSLVKDAYTRPGRNASASVSVRF